MTEDDDPPVTTVRSNTAILIIYGFGNALGSGFGTTLLKNGSIHYQIGTWAREEEVNSSNWREFENLVLALEESGKKGWLKGASIILATDNEVAEAAIYKGNSSSEKLYKLVVWLRKLELFYSAKILVSHVAGTRMIAQGTDGVSRGALNTGVGTGTPLLDFCPWHKSSLETAPKLGDWIRSWAGHTAEFLQPNDWFLQGHDVCGGYRDKQGFWHNSFKSGIFVWSPPPAAADACLKEIRKARLKRRKSTLIIVIPKLMTPLWLRLFNKEIDMTFTIPATSNYPFWPTNCHELLIVGIIFPYLTYRPW